MNPRTIPTAYTAHILLAATHFIAALTTIQSAVLQKTRVEHRRTILYLPHTALTGGR